MLRTAGGLSRQAREPVWLASSSAESPGAAEALHSGRSGRVGTSWRRPMSLLMLDELVPHKRCCRACHCVCLGSSDLAAACLAISTAYARQLGVSRALHLDQYGAIGFAASTIGKVAILGGRGAATLP